MANFTLKINGLTHQVDVDSDTPLLWVLRDELNLVGTKYGCGIALCGTCTVHLNGQPTRSCVTTVSMAENADILTIEGLSEHGDHPLQEAWKEVDVPQCGYCQAGQIMSAAALLKQNPKPNREDVRSALNGNICRCAAYNRIEEAVLLAAKKK
jgi:isoquinoline 1-oxidoreductase alpha subunit